MLLTCSPSTCSDIVLPVAVKISLTIFSANPHSIRLQVPMSLLKTAMKMVDLQPSGVVGLKTGMLVRRLLMASVKAR